MGKWISSALRRFVLKFKFYRVFYHARVLLNTFPSSVQATLNDTFLADLDELSDNEADILVSIFY